MLNQPKAVWAVALTAMIAFMGLGLVDPILPMISEQLGATTTQTSLLFTSYLAITAVGMFFTSAISSRLGSRTTLLIGLTIIVIGAAGAGFSGSIGEIIAFRALWGLGNVLFISTALATIVNESSGSTGGAIILYEAALGLGLAVGPLLGGILGGISWRGPFFGTATLMAIGAAIRMFTLKPTGRPATPSRVTAAFRALRHPSLLVMGVVALFYNMAFFVLMSFTPYPLGLPAMGIGLVFTGWGVSLAITSVFVAPILTRRWAPVRVLSVTLVLLTLTMAGFALAIDHLAALVVGMVLVGLQLGVMNTVMTEVVMEATTVPRQVASSAYSGVRFLGGAIAPPLATALAASFTMAAPYWFAAAALIVAVSLLVALRRHVTLPHGEPGDAEEQTAVLTGGGRRRWLTARAGMPTEECCSSLHRGASTPVGALRPISPVASAVPTHQRTTPGEDVVSRWASPSRLSSKLVWQRWRESDSSRLIARTVRASRGAVRSPLVRPGGV